MSTLVQDIRYAVRTLARSPGFTLAAIATLALGIGANTAIFTALDRLILRSLPVPHPENLRLIVTDRVGGINYNLSYPAFADLREHGAVFSGVMAYSPASMTLTSGPNPERINGAAVSAGFFTGLELPLALGRDIGADEDRPGAASD